MEVIGVQERVCLNNVCSYRRNRLGARENKVPTVVGLDTGQNCCLCNHKQNGTFRLEMNATVCVEQCSIHQ